MRRTLLAAFCLFFSIAIFSQSNTTLTVEKIMQDPKWIGTSPSSLQWSVNSKELFFNWNPDNALADSQYYITLNNRVAVKATVLQKQTLLTGNAVRYNTALNAYTYSKDGDVFYYETRTGITKRITQTTDIESNPVFSFNQSKIVYNRNQNLYSWDLVTGETVQLTNMRSGESSSTSRSAATGSRTTTTGNQQEDWLKRDQLQYFEVLRVRKEKKEASDAYNKNTKPKELRSVAIDDRIMQGLSISPDGRFISYSLFKQAANGKTTIVPSYVTESGYTTDIPTRTKVGSGQGSSESFVYDRVADTVISIKADSIPGVKDLPDYVKDYPEQLKERTKKNATRGIFIAGVSWSPKGTHLVYDLRSDDNKDRWLMLWDTASYALKLLNRQRDEAWIGGPGLFGSQGWINDNTFWYQSETTGYSHLYTIDVLSGKITQLTTGKFEVQQARLSNDKKFFFITTNEVHPGEQHFYRLNIATKQREKLTSMTGANQVTLSPDEKYMGILYSYSNKPWELYLQELKPKSNNTAIQITNKAQSDEFKAYSWKDPELISFTARDGAQVYARIYKPANPDPRKPAVLFVHGAGYLQNAHKWWSSYFREYMFNNMLADKGYYVMDIDYRGSAGYGRDWRTGIYRHMGGKDLTDQVDAVDYLVKNFGVDPKRVGLYGGSYGGFIALMALFTTPDVFAAGAALRPVTDWANYNHGYTADILNEPFNDSIAYRRSSPFYFAEGLKSELLILHGMLDVNVHFQDAVKLAQRLIELGKDNWELAGYPMEDHAFVEPSSWTDEYKRILKLFERVLKK